MLVEVPLGQQSAVTRMTDAEWHRELPVPLHRAASSSTAERWPITAAARPMPIWWVDSHTDRKHRTWSTIPLLTATAALITDPICPATSAPPLNQRRSRPSIRRTSHSPAPASPGEGYAPPG